jgi:mRNA-degrading endonuclease RelE of RelBE toxin-antitoxin system
MCVTSVIKKKCPDNYKETFRKELEIYLKARALFGLKNFRAVLCYEGEHFLLKVRVPDYHHKGKGGGYRVICAFNLKKLVVLLVRIYQKSDCENIPTKELCEAFVDCIK